MDARGRGLVCCGRCGPSHRRRHTQTWHRKVLLFSCWVGSSILNGNAAHGFDDGVSSEPASAWLLETPPPHVGGQRKPHDNGTALLDMSLQHSLLQHSGERPVAQ